MLNRVCTMVGLSVSQQNSNVRNLHVGFDRDLFGTRGQSNCLRNSRLHFVFESEHEVLHCDSPFHFIHTSRRSHKRSDILRLMLAHPLPVAQLWSEHFCPHHPNSPRSVGPFVLVGDSFNWSLQCISTNAKTKKAKCSEGQKHSDRIRTSFRWKSLWSSFIFLCSFFPFLCLTEIAWLHCWFFLRWNSKAKLKYFLNHPSLTAFHASAKRWNSSQTHVFELILTSAFAWFQKRTFAGNPWARNSDLRCFRRKWPQ